MAELEDRKRALIRDLERARSELSAHATGARAHLHPAAKIQQGFIRHRFAWMGAAGLFGLILSKIGGGKKQITIGKKDSKPAEKAGAAALGLGVLKITFDLLRPVLMRWAAGRVQGLAGGPRRR